MSNYLDKLRVSIKNSQTNGEWQGVQALCEFGSFRTISASVNEATKLVHIELDSGQKITVAAQEVQEGWEACWGDDFGHFFEKVQNHISETFNEHFIVSDFRII